MVIHLEREEKRAWCSAPEGVWAACRTTLVAETTCHECLWAALVYGEACDRRLTQLWRENMNGKQAT